MRPLPTGRVVDKIFAVNNDFVNWFLVEGDSGFVAIDGGANNDKSLSELSALGIQLSNIKNIVITHDHPDHIGILELLKDIPVYGMSEKYATTVVKDGQELSIDGVMIKVYSTMGHKADHVCLVLNNRYLLTGDCLSLCGSKVGLFVSAYNLSNDVQANDIKKISQIKDIEKVITSHFGMTDKPDWSDFV